MQRMGVGEMQLQLCALMSAGGEGREEVSSPDSGASEGRRGQESVRGREDYSAE